MAKIESKQELASKLQVIIDWSEQLLKTIRSVRKRKSRHLRSHDPACADAAKD